MDQTKLNLARIRAYDADPTLTADEWDESKHPRKANGQFGTGGGAATRKNASTKTATKQKKLSTGANYNQKDLVKLANKHLNYHLGHGETDASVEKVKILSAPDKDGNVDAKVNYSVNVRIPYTETDSDGYSWETYEDETEYRTDTISLNIKDLKPIASH